MQKEDHLGYLMSWSPFLSLWTCILHQKCNFQTPRNTRISFNCLQENQRQGKLVSGVKDYAHLLQYPSNLFCFSFLNIVTANYAKSFFTTCKKITVNVQILKDLSCVVSKLKKNYELKKSKAGFLTFKPWLVTPKIGSICHADKLIILQACDINLHALCGSLN